jgi:hypothetical protein
LTFVSTVMNWTVCDGGSVHAAFAATRRKFNGKRPSD